MPGTDLVTRLILDNKNFESKLKQSKSEVSTFSELGSKAGQMLGKLAAAFGIASSATEAFQSTINASKETLDEFNTLQQVISAEQNSFWAALNSGEPTRFISNIRAVADAARETYDAINRLKNINIFSDAETAKIDAELEYWSTRVDNTDLSEQERKDASDKKQELLQRKIDITKQKSEQSKAAYLASLKSALAEQGVTDISDEQILQMFSTHEQYEEQLKKFMDFKKKIDANTTTATFNTSMGAVTTQTKNKTATDIENSREYKIAKAISSIKQEDIERAKAYEAASYQAQEELYAKQHEDQNERLGLLKEMADANNKASQSATEQAQIQIDMKKELEAIKVEFKIPETTLQDLLDEKAQIIYEMNHSNQKDYVKLKVKLENVDKRIEDFKSGEGLMSQPDMSGVEVKWADPNAKSNKKKTDYSDQIEGLNSVATCLQTVSNLTDEGAAAWITYGANILTTIASAIPAITALTAVKDAEAQANGKAAATGAASSVSSVPFVGPMLAVAAVASIIAALMAIPKFASGGVVGGNKMFGDYNIARVNSGEMILNNNQQRRLFDIINNGGTSTNSNAKVEFKIQGRELVGVLKNYNSKISKVQ